VLPVQSKWDEAQMLKCGRQAKLLNLGWGLNPNPKIANAYLTASASPFSCFSGLGRSQIPARQRLHLNPPSFRPERPERPSL
jgi:hypothetical protein